VQNNFQLRYSIAHTIAGTQNNFENYDVNFVTIL